MAKYFIALRLNIRLDFFLFQIIVKFKRISVIEPLESGNVRLTSRPATERDERGERRERRGGNGAERKRAGRRALCLSRTSKITTRYQKLLKRDNEGGLYNIQKYNSTIFVQKKQNI
ncbi:hypothetical protein EVAR_70757_1 [Eumeta japonica]|uniref:Uncharacterized protein n=1 Tax=Eumeta variegata TaxID=151549 RepID=A0A4C1SHK4_EUMVA|nr:hypothetical protein EVAR_70757_1 [Eumeta japonica]